MVSLTENSKNKLGVEKTGTPNNFLISLHRFPLGLRFDCNPQTVQISILARVI